MYSSSAVQKMLKVSKGTLQEWVDRGFVKPSKTGNGCGTRASWSEIDIVSVMLFQKLLSFGLDRKHAGDCVTRFKNAKRYHFGIHGEVLLIKFNKYGKSSIRGVRSIDELPQVGFGSVGFVVDMRDIYNKVESFFDKKEDL
jgi:hypothetical protein